MQGRHNRECQHRSGNCDAKSTDYQVNYETQSIHCALAQVASSTHRPSISVKVLTPFQSGTLFKQSDAGLHLDISEADCNTDPDGENCSTGKGIVETHAEPSQR